MTEFVAREVKAPSSFAPEYCILGAAGAFAAPFLIGFLGLSVGAAVVSPLAVAAAGYWRTYAASRYGRGRAASFAFGACVTMIVLLLV
jgi:hypothetical protein